MNRENYLRCRCPSMMPRTSSMWPLAAEYTPCSRETTSSAPSAAVGAYLGSESATCCMRWRSSLHQSAEMSISAIFLTIYTSSKQHQTVATSDSGNIRQRQHQTAATSDSSSTSGNIPDRTATSDSGNIRQQQHQWQHTGSNSCSLRYWAPPALPWLPAPPRPPPRPRPWALPRLAAAPRPLPRPRPRPRPGGRRVVVFSNLWKGLSAVSPSSTRGSPPCSTNSVYLLTSDSSSTSGNIPDRTATSDSGNIRQQQHQRQHTCGARTFQRETCLPEPQMQRPASSGPVGTTQQPHGNTRQQQQQQQHRGDSSGGSNSNSNSTGVIATATATAPPAVPSCPRVVVPVPPCSPVPVHPALVHLAGKEDCPPQSGRVPSSLAGPLTALRLGY
jgi:hypothetical protein